MSGLILPDRFGEKFTEIHPYTISYSILGQLHTCERKFQIERLLEQSNDRPPSFPVPLVRGHAFGIAIQHYIIHGDMDLAVAQLWLAYEPEVYDERTKVYLWRAVNNLLCCKDALDKIRQRYKVAEFKGKPAAELAFSLAVDDRWSFEGHIDMVLYDTYEKIYVIFEIKTTGWNLVDLKPVYRNQSQPLGYSIAIDQIVGEDQNKYGVLYFVCRDKQGTNFIPDVYTFYFPKTLLDRLKWFYTIQLDVQRLNTMLENDLFPMRGQSCVNFNRVCPHFGTCGFTSADIPLGIPKDKLTYDFHFKMSDVIEDHLRRVSSGVGIGNEVQPMEDLNSITVEEL